jgi:hypothetical protein
MDDIAYVDDSGVMSSVRKRPGLTIVVVMANGSTSCCSESSQPSSPCFHAACGEQNSKPARPAPEEIAMMCLPDVRVGGVVEQHVDPAEPIDRGLHRGARAVRVGDVELDDQQVVSPTERISDDLRIAPGGDDRVAGGQRSLGEIRPMPRPAPVMYQTSFSVMALREAPPSAE